MRHLIERLDRAVVAEAKKPYVPQSREAQQALEADLHDEVAEAARVVLRAVEALAKVVQKGRAKAGQMTGGTGTFAETQEKINGAEIGPFMVQLATDHTRWAKNIRDALKGA